MPGIWFFLPVVGFTVKLWILTQFIFQANLTNQNTGKLSDYVLSYFILLSKVLIHQLENYKTASVST